MTSKNLPITTASAYACRDSPATHQPDELGGQEHPVPGRWPSREELPRSPGYVLFERYAKPWEVGREEKPAGQNSDSRVCSSAGRAPALQFSGLMRCAHLPKRKTLRSEESLVRCSAHALLGRASPTGGRGHCQPVLGRPQLDWRVASRGPRCRYIWPPYPSVTAGLEPWTSSFSGSPPRPISQDRPGDLGERCKAGHRSNRWVPVNCGPDLDRAGAAQRSGRLGSLVTPRGSGARWAID